jgi:hypothetical protein
MERLNDDGQWIVLMGFVISIAIFFLAILLNQSVLVGQTTAESVLEFPKSDIQDLRSEVWVIYSRYKEDTSTTRDCIEDINQIAMARKTAVIQIVPDGDANIPPGWIIHFNNGVTDYYEEVGNDEYGYYYFYY